MSFDVIIDDQFLQLFYGSALKHAENISVLSLANDYEDQVWRWENFDNFVWDNIALTALSASERSKLIGKSSTILRHSARNLRLTDKLGDISEGSELAEIVLYGVMQQYFNALPVVPKIFYKQNSQDNAKGADSVHIVLDGKNDFSLWCGEAKFYNSLDNSRFASIIKSVGNSLNTEKLRKENSIVTNLADVECLLKGKRQAKMVRDALSPASSMDTIRPRLRIPILLLHECEITARSKVMNDEYRQELRAYHLDRSMAYFEKQVEVLAKEVAMYSSIKFHLILIPVPNRKDIVTRFSNAVAFQKG